MIAHGFCRATGIHEPSATLPLPDYFRIARHSSRVSGRARRVAQRTHRDWFGTAEFPFPKAGGRRE